MSVAAHVTSWYVACEGSTWRDEAHAKCPACLAARCNVVEDRLQHVPDDETENCNNHCRSIGALERCWTVWPRRPSDAAAVWQDKERRRLLAQRENKGRGQSGSPSTPSKMVVVPSCWHEWTRLSLSAARPAHLFVIDDLRILRPCCTVKTPMQLGESKNICDLSLGVSPPALSCGSASIIKRMSNGTIQYGY